MRNTVHGFLLRVRGMATDKPLSRRTQPQVNPRPPGARYDGLELQRWIAERRRRLRSREEPGAPRITSASEYTNIIVSRILPAMPTDSDRVGADARSGRCRQPRRPSRSPANSGSDRGIRADDAGADDAMRCLVEDQLGKRFRAADADHAARRRVRKLTDAATVSPALATPSVTPTRATSGSV